MRLLDLYRHTPIQKRWRAHWKNASISSGNCRRRRNADGARRPGKGPGAAVRAYFAESSAGAAAKFMSRADGPRVGALFLLRWMGHACR